jgi:hypothetical protein
MNKIKMIAGALAVGAIAASSASANILVNPGFETDTIGQVPLTGWTRINQDVVKGTDLDITPHGGTQQMQLQNDFSQLYQVVTIAEAGEFELSMWVANRNNNNHYMPSLTDTHVDTVPVQFELLQGDYSLGVDIAYTDFVANQTIVAADTYVTADFDDPKGTYVNWTRTYDSLSAGTYTVWITNGTRGGSSRSEQGMFDDITLTAIPEPATLGMVAVFGGGILFIRRRFMI